MQSSTTVADDRPPAPLVAALEYAGFGYGVFPCVAKNRAPIRISGVFEHGFKSATLDAAVITATWTKYKAAEVGLAPPPGILVVDPDMKKGRSGRADFIRLFGRAPEDMPTAVATTPLGGWHVYLSFDSLLDLTQRPITPSVDVKVGGKGYVLAPYAGNGRRWILPLLTTPLMPAPAWLIDALGRAPERRSTGLGGEAKPFAGQASARASQALDKACAALAAAPPGTRDATIGAAVFRVGRLAGAGELEPEAALEAMLQAMASNPGTNESHLDKVARQFSSGLKQPAEPGPVNDRNADDADFGDEGDDDDRHDGGGEQPSQPSSSSQVSQQAPSSSRSSSSSSSQSTSGQPWPDFDALLFKSDIPPPKLTDDMLPSEWAKPIHDYAAAKRAPPGYVAGAAIGASAGLIGNAYIVQATPAWRQPAPLWIALVGPPADGKTPAMDELARIVKRIDRQLRAEWKAACKKIEAQNQAAADAHADKTGKKGKAPKPLKKPALVQLWLDDVTIEKVAQTMAASPHGVLGYYDELARWFASHSRYSDSDISARTFWAGTYDVTDLKVDRIKLEELIVVPMAAASICGGIQPDRLREFWRSADDGILERFLYVWPYPAPWRPVDRNDRGGFYRSSVRVFSGAFEGLYALPANVDEDGVPHPVVLPLSSEAQDLFDLIDEDCTNRARDGRGAHARWLGKGVGRVLRLALAFELMGWALREDALPAEVSYDTIMRAWRYFRYAEEMFRRTAAGIEPGVSSSDARDIAETIVKRQADPDPKKKWGPIFTNSQIGRERGFNWFRGESQETKQRRANALAVLADGGVIRPAQAVTGRGVIQKWEARPDLDEELRRL
jgi:hypothetical protein